MSGRPCPILDEQGARPLNERLRPIRSSRGLFRAALPPNPGWTVLARGTWALMLRIAQRYVAAIVLVTPEAIRPPSVCRGRRYG